MPKNPDRVNIYFSDLIKLIKFTYTKLPYQHIEYYYKVKLTF